jgi:cytochrome c oxidase subunit 2
VPFIIVACMGFAATKTVVAQKDTSNADLTIKVTGYQWKWGYEYLKGPGEGIQFLSTLDPAQRQMSDAGHPSGTTTCSRWTTDGGAGGQKVRIITTANDVIHSWMMPAFGVKQDAIPGFVRTPGSAPTAPATSTASAPSCAARNTYMPIHVRVLSADDYAQWVAGEKKRMADAADDPKKVWTLDDLMARGQQVYAANCAVCHGPTARGRAGQAARWLGQGAGCRPSGRSRCCCTVRTTTPCPRGSSCPTPRSRRW